MSWIQDLQETYDACAGREPDGDERLMPIGHTTQQAHVEIVLDQDGHFKRASVIEKNEATTLIPCTEVSGGRTGSKPANHPLADKLQYVAGDFARYGGTVTSGFSASPKEPHERFLKDLEAWAASPHTHAKLGSILRYVKQGTLIKDLVDQKILPCDANNTLLKSWGGAKESIPPIFKVIPNTQVPADAFIRWRVEEVGNPLSATWEDPELIDAWIRYYQSIQTKRGLCMALGTETALAVQHPAKLRHAGDKAKLISSNDSTNYTFRGRFLEADEAASVGFEATQKAHNALRWLIQRQGTRNGDQVVVSWASAGQPIPNPLADSWDLFGLQVDPSATVFGFADTAQSFASRLDRAIKGYGETLQPDDDVVVMAMDAATPGRISIAFYRKLKGSVFLERIEAWHSECAWLQNFGKNRTFTGAPAPRDIAEAAYGRRLDDKLKKSTVERLLPCIVDAAPLPRDLVESTVRRVCNRVGFKEHWEWEKCLGIACALFKGYHKERKHQMGLEQGRVTRDYLYGRLLAVAERIESLALSLAEEKRDTMAARLMQRFADRPYSTWKTIELSLTPYKSRLRVRRAGFLHAMETLLDDVTALFQGEDFTKDAPLSGEFLLGYHCQRQELHKKKETNRDEQIGENATETVAG